MSAEQRTENSERGERILELGTRNERSWPHAKALGHWSEPLKLDTMELKLLSASEPT